MATQMGMIPKARTKKMSPMTDKSKTKPMPKVGDDFDEKKMVAGSMVPSRDGPAKKSANPPVQVPDTSSPAPASQQNAGIKSQSGMPAAMKDRIASMRKSLKK